MIGQHPTKKNYDELSRQYLEEVHENIELKTKIAWMAVELFVTTFLVICLIIVIMIMAWSK